MNWHKLINSFWDRPWLCAAAVALVVSLNVVWGGWILDDFYQVHWNSYVQELAYLPHLFSHSVWESSTPPKPSDIYRPLMMISFLVDYMVWGARPWGYHLTNLLLHIGIVAALVHWLRLIGAGRLSTMIAVLFFVTTPLNSETVNWISARNDLLATLLGLIALIMALKKRGLGRLLLVSLFLGLALLSKENLIVLPVLIFLQDLMVKGDESWRPWMCRCGLLYVVCALVVAAYMIVRASVLNSTGTSVLADYSFAIHLFILGEYVLRSLQLYPMLFSRPFDPGAVGLSIVSMGIGLFVCAIGLVAYRVHRRLNRIGFGVLGYLLSFFFIAIAVVSTEELSDRYAYFPLLFFALILGESMAEVMRWMPKRAGRVVLCGCIVIGLCAGALSFHRNRDWRNEIELHSQDLTHDQRNWLAWFRLAQALHRSEGPPQAAQLRHALPAYAKAYEENSYNLRVANNYGLVLDRMGYSARAADIVRRIVSYDGPARYDQNLGLIEYNRGRVRIAQYFLQRSIKKDGSLHKARFFLGVMAMKKGRKNEAKEHFKRLLRDKPNHGEARRLMDRLLLIDRKSL